MKLTNTQREYIEKAVKLKWERLMSKEVLIEGLYQCDVSKKDVEIMVIESVEECIEFINRY